MKTYTVQRILFLLIIIHLSYFKLNGQEVDTIKEKVTIVEEIALEYITITHILGFPKRKFPGMDIQTRPC